MRILLEPLGPKAKTIITPGEDTLTVSVAMPGPPTDFPFYADFEYESGGDILCVHFRYDEMEDKIEWIKKMGIEVCLGKASGRIYQIKIKELHKYLKKGEFAEKVFDNSASSKSPNKRRAMHNLKTGFEVINKGAKGLLNAM